VDGVLVIDKPAGMTSHDVIDAVRKKLKIRRVGHGGTLDPDATGVLLVGTGRATRFLSYAQAAPKRYRAVAIFGITTSTQDASGEVLRHEPAHIDADKLREALIDFTGPIEQIPPMVSAVKVEGERLYRKARRGEEVERKARAVTIHALDLVELIDEEYPRATLDVVCSGGTFVRTLVHDLGDRIGCGAHLGSLRRTEAGGFTLEDAITLGDVSPETLRPLVDAVRVLPAIEVDEATASDVAHGRSLPAESGTPASELVALVSRGRLLAVYRHEKGRLIPDRVVSA
jgi:tRNA pseudouridine55 synthase